ncbi:MAG: AI-2E family transporter [bacterium]
MSQRTVNNVVLVLMIVVVSAIFLVMIRQYLMPIFLAALFTALVTPFYQRLLNMMGGREGLASITTLLLLLFVVLLPLGMLGGIVVGQAIDVGQSVTPWIQKFIREPSALAEYLQVLPYYDELLAHREEILNRVGQTVAGISQFLASNISALTREALHVLFMTFIMLYVMFFFLSDGEALLNKILYYLPLTDDQEQQLLERFTSVGRATIKGTAVIGMLQGGICGIGFVLAGIANPVFWATLMAVASIIPLFGTALIWVPAMLILALAGDWSGVIILLVVCGVIAGNLDNFIRPRLVGKDTQMHEIMILVSTLGGISMFGIIGIIIGPIIAALFVTFWDIYGITFRQVLPPVPGSGDSEHRD